MWASALIAGEAVAVSDGFRGQALNLAARLCAHAKAGDVLISEAMHHLVGRIEGITTRDVGRERMKGFSEPVRVVKVVFPLELPPVAAARRRRRSFEVALIGIGVAAAALGAALLIRNHQSPAPVAQPVQASDIGTGIYRVNLTTGHVGLVPTSRDGSPVGGLIRAFGSTWVSARDAVVRLDARGRVVTRVPGVTDAVGSMAAGDGRLWVMSTSPSPVGPDLAVALDPSNPTGEHEAPRGVPMQRVQESREIVDNVLFGFGSLWAYPTGSQACCPGRVFWRVKPADGTVLAKWLGPQGSRHRYRRHMGAQGRQHGRANLPAHQQNRSRCHLPEPPRIDARGRRRGSLGRGPPTLGTITEISPRTKTIVNHLHVKAHVDGIIPTGGALWIVDRDNFALLDVNPNTGRVVHRYQLGDIPPNSSAVVVNGDTALVAFP